MDRKTAMLRSVFLFQDLTNAELIRVSDISMQRECRKKEIIFTEGSNKEAVYFLLDGLVKAYKTDKNGNEHIVSILQTGEMFPHTGFFNDEPYPATAEAIVPTQLLAIPVSSFEQLMISTPEIAVKVMRVMSSKIKELQEKLQGITSHDVQNRCQIFLLKLAENYGTLKNGKVYIDVPMTNQEIADSIGTTRETVTRLINAFRKQNIIEKNRKGIVILDLESLKK